MTTAVSHYLRLVAGRVLYALVLWVVISSTLEQFAGVNERFLIIGESTFHLLVLGIALTAAAFEAVTLLGISGLQNLWQRPDPIDDIMIRNRSFHVALDKDLVKVRKLAKKRYGFAFTIKALRRWHSLNPRCLYLMVSDGELVGYVDAFPISAGDFQHLVDGLPEYLITPLRDHEVDDTCSFYIASVVIEEGWGGLLPALLKRTLSFYSNCYSNKAWTRVCAIAYSAAGRALLELKGAQLYRAQSSKVDMFTIDRNMLPGLSRPNRALWSKLLP